MLRLIQRKPASYTSVASHDGDVDIESVERSAVIQEPIVLSIDHDKPSVQNADAIVRWGIDWKMPAKMIALLLAGGAVAVGHHIFYESLDGKLVGSGDSTPSQGGQ